MPVLKAQAADTFARDAIVLDLGDLGRQAGKLRRAARVKAAAILHDARQHAAQLVEEAKSKGFEDGRAAGFEQGLAEGREQGRQEALSQAAQQLQQLQASWGQAVDQLDASRRELDSQGRQAVAALALRLAEKLVYRAIETDPSVVVDQVGEALSHVLRPLDVTVRIHPDDKPMVEEAMPALAAKLRAAEHVELVEDEQLARGGCLVTYGQGEIDATIETQLRRVAQALVPGLSETPHPPTPDP